MEQQKSAHLMYGLVTGIVTAITGLIIYMSGKAFVSGMQYVPDIPFLIGIILNAMAFSRLNDGYVTFGNVFWNCFKATMIVTIVMVVWTIVHMLAMPEMKEKALAAARDGLMKRNLPDDQIDKSMEMMKNFYSTILISGALVGTLIAGAIFSAIGGAVAKKNRAMPTGDNF